MNEKTTANLWHKLESLYMMKSLSNKLFLKKQLYSLWMKEKTLQHLNVFNQILSDMLALETKLEEKDKTLLFCLLFPGVMITWGLPSCMKKRP